MKLAVKYGVDFEAERVKNTLAKLDWFRREGYDLDLPDDINADSSEVEVQRAVATEYSEDKYRETLKSLVVQFGEIEVEFDRVLRDVFGNDLPKEFEVYITRYGVGGSYHPPNTIVLNFNMNPLNTVIHEMVHLLVEPFVEKHGLSHWEKERVVDLILHSEKFSFLKYEFWQKDYHDVEKYLDPLFENKFFRNPEDFFARLGGARPVL